MKKMLFAVALLVTACVQEKETDLKLWYDEPAQRWTEALPVGNGRLGAMVFGDPAKEHLQLNEETVWAGQPNSNANPSVEPGAIDEIRKLIFDGKYRAAQDMVDQKIFFKVNHGMSYQSVGDLYLEFPGHENYSDFYRDLDISDAVASVRYKVDGVEYGREVISAFADDVVAVNLTASEKGKVTFNTSLVTPQKKHTVAVEDGDIVLRAVTGSMEGLEGKVEYTTRVRIVHKGGELTASEAGLSLSGADEATVLVSTGTSFVNYKDISADADKEASEILNAASSRKYASMKKAHVAQYREYFDRVELDLGTTPAASATTDVRVKDFAAGDDPQLVELYFQFGRYLLICSSQPGGQPANLQGIWADGLNPAWDSKYTTNINVEMNYWPAEITNLSELHEPFIQMAKEVAQTGAETARIMYGARGWVLHHNTDIWRITGPVDFAASGMWPTGGAWFCRHLWEHYLHTGDKDFLADVYPVMKGAAEFFVDFMIEEPDHGWLVVAPSNSPENAFMRDPGDVTVCAGTTMDNQMVSELFGNVITATELLGVDADFANTLAALMEKMAPMQIGKHAQLQEWMYDWDNPDDHHRHVSHLYGLFPGNQISPWRTPELFAAARNSLNYRGDPATGWSMGWKVCLWARLLDGNRAYKLITDQLSPAGSTGFWGKGGTYPNLFDAHPPFQIDGNFGCAAGIAEMMLQSHDGTLHVLPSVPDRWADGKVSGLVARGGFVVDIEWKDGKVTMLKVKSQLGGNLRIRTADQLVMKDGKALASAEGVNPNPYYAVPEVAEPLISKEAALELVPMEDTYLYDVATTAGKEYVFVAK
ncbi:MAG: glycoside hydrolase family 95 protein [Bacteroidales bacterium]|nr:glycoside hydrolase family 95 protein [Bacteroidales bacterium]